MALTAGQIAKTINIEVQKRKVKDNETIAVGDIVAFDSSGLCISSLSTSTIHEGLGVAMEAASGTGKSINVAVGNTYVCVTAGGAIKAMHLVKRGSTAAKVLAHDAPALCAGSTPTTAEVDAVRNGYALAVGRYVQKEGDAATTADAADTDVIIVRLGQ